MPCALLVGERIDAKIVAEAPGSRASPEKPAGAAPNTITNTTMMSSTLDHVPVPSHTSRHTLALLMALPLPETDSPLSRSLGYSD